MKLKFGYRAVTEQYPPDQLLDFAVRAEASGFDFICVSDHFHPWFHSRGQATFAWVWIAAAAERTRKVHIGTGVTTPLFRYSPGIVAQAFATLGKMYPGRIYLGLGTGEAMNEIPLGHPWPDFGERIERFEEAVKVIKMLWKEDFVRFKGKYYSLKHANLYTRPSKPIPLYIAAAGARAAAVAGKYADAFYTPPADFDHYRSVLFPALEKGAKEAGRSVDQIDKMVEITLSYDEDYDVALESTRIWAATLIPNMVSKPIYDPREIEDLGRKVELEKMKKYLLVCTDLDEIVATIEDYVDVGFNLIQIHSSSPDETEFIREFTNALQSLKEQYATQ